MRRVNLFRNPSLETSAFGFAGGSGGTFTGSQGRVAGFAWSGNYAWRCQFLTASVGAYQYQVIGSDTSDFAPVEAGVSYDVAMRWWSDNPNLSCKLDAINWHDATGTYLSSVSLTSYVYARNGVWNFEVKKGIVAPAGAAYARLFIGSQTNAAISSAANTYCDAFHLAPSSQGVDTYLDGSLGGSAGWTGLPGQSTSYIDIPDPVAPLLQTRGAITVQTALWLADRYGNKTERVSVRKPINGSITSNQDADIKRSLSLEVNDPETFVPFSGFVIPEITVSDAYGARVTTQVGHYVVMPPSRTLSPGRSKGTLEAKDLTWLLSQATVDNFFAAAGTDVGTVCMSLAYSIDFAQGQVRIPLTGVLLQADYIPAPGANILKEMTTLLNSANHYAPWATNAGIIVSAPYKDLQVTLPSASYSTESGATLVPPVTEEPNWDRLCNRVTVRNISPNQPAIWASIPIINPDHPLFYDPNDASVGCGFERAVTIDNAEVKTEADALALAKSILSEGSSYYRKLTIRTLIDLYADMHDVLALDIHHGNQVVYGGKWWRRTWKIDLRGVSAITESELFRVENWQ